MTIFKKRAAHRAAQEAARAERMKQEALRRRGLYSTQFVGMGVLNKGAVYPVTAEVTEMDRIGDLSKLRVDEVFGASDQWTAEHYAKSLAGWVHTSRVVWREDESSRSVRPEAA